MTLEKFFHKISKDLLISFIITYFLLLVPELVLPGIVSSHFNPKYLLILILILGLIFSWLGEKYPAKENIKFRAISRNLLNIILFVVLVMLALGLYKMKVWQILIVLALSIVLMISADKMLVSDSKK